MFTSAMNVKPSGWRSSGPLYDTTSEPLSYQVKLDQRFPLDRLVPNVEHPADKQVLWADELAGGVLRYEVLGEHALEVLHFSLKVIEATEDFSLALDVTSGVV